MTQKDKKQLIATGVLVIVLIFILLGSGKKNPENNKAKELPSGSSNYNSSRSSLKANLVPGSKNVSTSVSPKKFESFLDNLKVKRDPFSYQPQKSSMADNKSEIILNGIIWDEENPKAIINNFIFGVGDRIGAVVIKEIKKDRIIVNQQNKVSEILLGW
ncbi:MAG: hypothetical protein PHV17_08895 [Candidatus Omnitrophica bacterium]|nr:hypothetical protein [Candidatus Omnitrophota bacterium]